MDHMPGPIIAAVAPRTATVIAVSEWAEHAMNTHTPTMAIVIPAAGVQKTATESIGTITGHGLDITNPVLMVRTAPTTCGLMFRHGYRAILAPSERRSDLHSSSTRFRTRPELFAYVRTVIDISPRNGILSISRKLSLPLCRRIFTLRL